MAALAAADPQPSLDRMVVEAPLKMARHYPELRDGMLAMIRKERPVGVVPTSVATWSAGNLTIKINHVVGLLLPGERRVLALLYFKEPRLTGAGARPALRVMEYEVSSALPGAIPAILDARRGKLIFMPKNAVPSKLDRLLVGEAAGYLAHWQAVAA